MESTFKRYNEIMNSDNPSKNFREWREEIAEIRNPSDPMTQLLLHEIDNIMPNMMPNMMTLFDTDCRAPAIRNFLADMKNPQGNYKSFNSSPLRYAGGKTRGTMLYNREASG